MKKASLFFLLSTGVTLGLLISWKPDQGKIVWLSSLDLNKMSQGSDKPKINENAVGKPFSIAQKTFSKGVGTRARSYVWIDLGGTAEKFSAYVGIDDGTAKQALTISQNFKVLGDNKELWQSGPMHYRDQAKKVELNLKGIKTLILVVVNTSNTTNNLQADWADAQFLVRGQDPKTIAPPVEPAVIYTPKPGLTPKINGPKIYGCRPGNPFLYRIPATGKRPMVFTTENLPKGLILNPRTGIVTGAIKDKGEFIVTLKARNNEGNDSRIFKIVSGDKLALTPTMGWNTWYAYYGNISDKIMREAADSLISNGMADVGYQYVDIDDCWSNVEKSNDKKRIGPRRDINGNVLPNVNFPDMKGMNDYIHSKGLKTGIYSSPGPLTCATYTGSYNYEAQDAKQFATWGFDLLKYDWCSYGKVESSTTDEARQKSYRIMGRYYSSKSEILSLTFANME